MKLISQKISINSGDHRMKMIILKPQNQQRPVNGILWIHGGGYETGMAEMVYMSCGKMLAERFGGVVVSPQYRLSGKSPYPAALLDCYAALKYMDEHRRQLGIDRIVVGGESAGGGLTAALCLYNRDKGDVKIDYQIPLYPMLDCNDTESSADNHGKIWNTRRNHSAWKRYLRNLYQTDDVPVYASPAREKDYRGLPACYTFVCDGEPFYRETLDYIENLNKAGIRASVDVYHGDVHSFDLMMFWTKKARKARERLCEVYQKDVLGK